MTDKIMEIIEYLKSKNPLIHCITNPISINQCANAILSVGAKPVMAEHPKEVCEITCSSNALMLNVGNITDARMESVIISSKTAYEKNIPFLLDIVGIACSTFRREYIYKLLKNNIPSVIKGNYSEINALYDASYFSAGVDADKSIDEKAITPVAEKLAKKHKTVILATGKTDVITDGERTVFVRNGTPALASVTGTGCMLGALCATFMASKTPMDAAVSACCYLGVCGELSETHEGSGSFMIKLMDNLSTLKNEDIKRYCKMEEKT